MSQPFETVDFTPLPPEEAAALKAARIEQVAKREELDQLQAKAAERGRAHREGLVVLLAEPQL
jgi:hypothetical protein